MSDLLVMIPTRGRRKQCERLLKSFQDNTVDAEILFIIDDDDEETYEGMDWGDAQHGVLGPRESLTGKLNRTSDAVNSLYKYLMFVGDDHVFRTPEWDKILREKFDVIGGTGMIYPDDRRRNDVPEIIAISTDIVRVLGHFAEPMFKHYYIDNAWMELGKRTGMIFFTPDIVVEHLHYGMRNNPEAGERDATYIEAENAWGDSDNRAYQEWRATAMPIQVARLRRAFNPDIKWVFSSF